MQVEMQYSEAVFQSGMFPKVKLLPLRKTPTPLRNLLQAAISGKSHTLLLKYKEKNLSNQLGSWVPN